MPQTQRGQAYRLGPNRWGLRFYVDGQRRRKSPFPSKSAALQHYRDVVQPELRGDPAPMPDVTLGAFVPVYLERHAASGVRPRTITDLRKRLLYATRAYGDVPLRDLERMAGELATWQARLPERSRYGIVGALRQALAAAVRWGHMARNPAVDAGRNRQPTPRTVRAYSRAELDALALELPPPFAPLPVFAAATGLRPEEWIALERRDIDRRAGVLTVARTVSSGEVVELGKTTRSRRQVPLSHRALAALDAIPPRLDSPRVFPATRGGVLNVDNFRRRQWAPAVEAAGIRRPARLYDLRSTFASDALAAGVTIFELARIMGTSVQMIERSYGTLLEGAAEGIAGRLDTLDAERDRAAAERSEDV